jgi:hypothetical protein
MKKSKRKINNKRKKSNKKLLKQQISEKRSKAAKVKKKANNHRRKYKQKKSIRGFGAIVGKYIDKKLEISKDFNGFEKGKNSTYKSYNIITSLIFLMIMGLSRVFHAKGYQEETLLAKTINLDKFPSDSVYYRFLKKFPTLTFCKRLRRINRDQIRKPLLNSKEVTLDGDWSKIQSYQNKKEGACKGHNKSKPSSPCFQAMLYFANGLCVLPQILAGNKVPLKSFSIMYDLEEARRLCGRIDWIRLDGGFASEELLKKLDEFSCTGNSIKKIRFVINAGTTCIGAKEAIDVSKCREWIQVGKYKKVFWQDHGICKIHQNSDKIYRLILVKEYFKGGKAKGKWRYYTIVSNDKDMLAKDLFFFYHQRQTIENFFDEAKNDYKMENLPCSKLLGNAVYFHIICLAYNLMYFLKHDLLRKEDWNIHLSTFRRNYLQVHMEFDGNNLFIFRYCSYKYRKFIQVLHRLKKLNIFLEYFIC